MTVAEPSSPQRDDHAPLLERAFDFVPPELSCRIEAIEGEIPGYLRGSYYLTGPACFEMAGLRYRHWLDGDGMVCRLGFGGDGIHFASRYVRGAKLLAEEEAGRRLYRAFGTAFEADRLKRGLGLESPLNVSVYPFAGTVLAFGEQGLPWELDPETLATRGEWSFGGRLNAISPFAAHPAFDYRSGEMVNFGVSFSATRPSISLYRFDAAGTLVHRSRLPIERPCSLHDFGLAPRHAVFYLAPYELDIDRLLREGATLLDSLVWRPEHGTRLLVADRESGAEVASIPIGSAYSLHFIDCFEERGNLVVDVLELDRPVYDQYEIDWLFPEPRGAQPVRYVVDVEAGTLVDRVGFDYHHMCDFAAIDPRRATSDYGDFWLLGIGASERPGRKFFDELVHADWHSGRLEAYRAPRRHYLGGEPVFMPDPSSESAGTVICQQFDAEGRRSAFLLFDAFDVARGPVATLWLPEPIHLGFHASYAPAAGGGKEGERR